MIVVKIYGGLGNQMFQYSLGRALTYARGIELKFDLSFFDNSGQAISREYGLKYFNISGGPLGLDQIKNNTVSRFRQFLERIFPYYKRKIVHEPYYHFAPDVFKLKDGAWLDGYWQSEKYFSSIGDVIRRDFTLKDEYNNLPSVLIDEIKKNNSVSVHFRRGDYVSNNNINSLIGIQPMDYYEHAIKFIKSKIENPKLFIFSDDIKWVKENFKTNLETVFVSEYGLKDYQEMIAMSECKHNILANSSFSWWGAWLNKNPNKIVIAPKRWFSDYDVNIKDLIPEDWIRL